MFSTKNILVNNKQFTQLITQLGKLLSNQTDFVIDSRKVKHGSFFCAYPGTIVDGRDYIDQAVDKGASVVLFEDGYTKNIDAISYSVKNLMQYVGLLAAYVNDFPSQNLQSIAITGTNGKTSISHWLNQAFTYLGKKTAIIGTTGCGIYPNISDYSSTTPDPITLQKLLKDFTSEKVDVLAMEVSSHALDQGRVNGMSFNTAIFTNLTQDHLDYHKTMDNYFLAKEQLFYWQSLENAIINADDEYGLRIILNLQNNDVHKHKLQNIISYGICNGDLRACDLQLDLNGINFNLTYNELIQKINVPIIGKFNIYNLLAVFASLLCSGVPFNQLSEVASNLQPVVGRMDAKIIKGKPLVVVDYSHTPDSLQKALETLKEIPHNRLICVFGCGGNRDKAKRPMMGNISTQLADLTIITSDNPRNEDPNVIIQDILSGVKSKKYIIEENRHLAISNSILSAEPNDIILIAGKGHEDYQEINGIKHYFSDLDLRDEFLTKYEI